jgi:sporulation protein YlmC with PRC-barrel domain
MRLKELRGLPVIDPGAARRVGTVTDYQVDAAASRLAALDIAPVDPSDGERILSHRIRRVGRHAVILTGRDDAAPTGALENSAHWLDTPSLEGLEVLGDNGDRVGHLMDATFDPDSLDVDAYMLRSTFWERFIGRRGRVQPNTVHACSREIMIVTSGPVRERIPETRPVSEVADATAEPSPIGASLKVDDRVPAPSVSPAENGKRVPARVE